MPGTMGNFGKNTPKKGGYGKGKGPKKPVGGYTAGSKPGASPGATPHAPTGSRPTTSTPFTPPAPTPTTTTRRSALMSGPSGGSTGAKAAPGAKKTGPAGKSPQKKPAGKYGYLPWNR